MPFPISQLTRVMDIVRSNPGLEPKPDGTTYCNFNALMVAEELGCRDIFPRGIHLLANELIKHMETSPSFLPLGQDHDRAYARASAGCLVFAGAKELVHGHIAPLYPAAGLITSGLWKAQVPHVSNVGKRNAIMGVNFAFSSKNRPMYFEAVV